MFQINLKNNKSFHCDGDTSILEAAKKADILLEHSCMSGRCNSCKVKVLSGDSINIQDEEILSKEEIEQGYILTCISKPLSNIDLDIEDLGGVKLQKPRTLPAKINSIERIEEDVIKLILRLPPASNFKFSEGQYVNIIKEGITRSYSIANSINDDCKVEFYIKKYESGLMSNYWFLKAKENDLLRLEGPLGTFVYRNLPNVNDIILLATGTGIAPLKAILEQFEKKPEICNGKKVWLIWGARYTKDIFWNPDFNNFKLRFIPVLSRENEDWKGELGYVQDIVIKRKVNLSTAQVYACGSIDMIDSSKRLFIENSLPEGQFYSDAFISSN